MGFQLWTSPETGYRRRGTRASELRALYELGLTARAIYEPLTCCRVDDPPHEVLRVLEDLDFDVVGVRDEDNRPFGFLGRKQLAAGLTPDKAEPFGHTTLVTESTPISALLRQLAESPQVFILSHSLVVGIVTRADLLKPPVRVVLFGLISLLEMHLTYWVKAKYPHDSWAAKLTPARLAKARQLLEVRRRQNEAISLIDCLQWCDKGNLLADDAVMCEALGLGDKRSAKRFFGDTEALRNDIAHSQDDYSPDGDWQAVAELTSAVERVLDSSDALVEQQSGVKRVVPAAMF